MKKVLLDRANYNRYCRFYKHYQLQNEINISKYTRKANFGGDSKYCRFCNRSTPDISFKSAAHVIPQSLGNRYLISRFECDACNDVFSRYENSFVNYLGIYRTLSLTKGKKGTGVPKFKDKKFGISAEELEENKIQLHASKEDSVKYDPDESKLTIKSTRDVFVPIHIFKLITKIGISMIPEDQLVHFEKTLKFLITEHIKITIGHDAFKMIKYFIPGPLIQKNPSACLYKLKNPRDELPNNIVTFNYANLMFQIILPFSALDDDLYNRNLKTEVPIAPLRIDKRWFDEFGNYTLEILDQSSSEEKIDESNDVAFTMTNFKKVTAPNTG